MRFALRPYAPAEAGGLLHEAALWRCEPLAGQIEHMWNLEAPHGEQGPHLAADGAVAVSACAPRLDGPGAVVRLFNSFAEARTVTLRHPAAWEAAAVDLDEAPTRAWSLEGVGAGWCRLSLPPLGLRTIAFARMER